MHWHFRTKLQNLLYKIQPKTLFVGQITHYLPSCQSTNDEASALIARGSAADGALVVTGQQTAGRGQRGNAWEAEPGQNLTFSLLLKPAFLRASEQFWLNMAVSLGLYDTLLSLAGDDLRIKWPNDLYVDSQKIGGILIENTLHGYNMAWSVVGVGLNINQTAFRTPSATSLQVLAPLPAGYDLPGLLSRLCETLEQRYLQLRSGQRTVLKADYLQTLYRYRVEHGFSSEGRLFRGTIIGIDATGRLVITEGDQVRYFGFKEVVFE